MKPIPDCVPDALRMILATAREVSDDEFIHRKVLLKVMGEIAEDGDLGSNPADFYLMCWETACRALGVRDPYENEKARGNKTALGILRMLAENYPCREEDKLRMAVRTSFAGAMLDFTGLGRVEMQEKIAERFMNPPARDDTDDLLEAIDRAESVLLVANRAGEIAMDRPLAELMAEAGKKVYLAVAAKPVFTMATEKDAETSGYTETVEIINPGTIMYGLVQERASSEFQDIFEEVDLLLVKGCTHFDTITPQREMYFILKATETNVAEKLDIPEAGGAIVRIDAPS
ncbi:MAG: ARMT1-like domain-containing protein [Planctomycetes bacterium]|nr:ARMT1-like domain-containing protein [Planctomycetota bacterium]